ncbi:MAG TPA: condensation domain-containing protein, partial [Pyrinomonadaceae bacterium]|nr:condensation domain-containing protein [Pyrinomonadaceae bacterium]
MSETNDLLARRRSELAARRGALSALKQQELDRLLKRTVAEEAPARVIPPRPAGEPAPLSFAQERLWFLYQLEPESTAYNVCLPLRMTGRLNVAALSQSLNEAVRRHESLRTTFLEVDGKPVQHVSPVRSFDLPLVDLTKLSDSTRQDVVRRLVREYNARRFDLAEGPLFQATLFRVGNEEHVLLVLLHHIVVDEWSKQLLAREVGQIQQSFDRGEASSLPELPIQYADFAHWHRQYLREEVIERELSYWRTQLEDSPAMLNLPVDRPRPPVMTYAGDALPIVVPQALTAKLRELTRVEGTSLFTTLLASFQMLLAQYTGQNDIVVATPVAGRRSLETEALIGFFVNTLLIRTRLSGNPPLREVIKSVRETVLEAQTHDDLPFEKLVEELHPERSLSHGPLFEVMFVYSSKPDKMMDVQDISTSTLEMLSGTEKFGLTFEITEGFDELNCLLSYRTDLFDRSTIERIARHWQHLLETMVADPDRLLSNVELLDRDERAQILTAWNDTAVSWPDVSFLTLFDKQVDLTPDMPAVQFGEQLLSYGELNARANQLAHHLRSLGAGLDTRIAICLEPGLEMVTAVLGVLKAGAAYVPLDPSYPAERLSFMLSNARCLAVLTNEALAAGLPETEATVLHVDNARQSMASESAAPPVRVEPENLAYVIYTSGSTGLPKGVAMTHGALSNLIAWQRRELPQAARTLQFASLSFDVSFQDIFA